MKLRDDLKLLAFVHPAIIDGIDMLGASETTSGLMQIVPTLVGGLLAITGGFVAASWQDHKKKKALRAALASEIRAIIEYLRPARIVTAAAVERMKHSADAMQYPTVDFRNTYSTVFSGNTQSLGLLNVEDAGKIVAFYYKFQGLIEDLTILEKSRPDSGTAPDEETRALVISKNEAIVKLCDEIISAGADLVNELDPPRTI